MGVNISQVASSMIWNNKNRLSMIGVPRWPMRLWLGLSCLLASLAAFGHGGVSMEDDVCLIKIGTYTAHFTGYLPQERAAQEFCEDIPIATDAVFVIDFISDELREMDIDFRIVRDINNVGRKATYEDLGGPEAIEKATVFYQKPKTYEQGVISIHFPFVENGGYVGIVDAHHRATGLSYRSVFPFSVGSWPYTRYLVYYVVLFLVCGIFIWASGRSSVFKPRPRLGKLANR